ncbi:MAG: hypothetical protein HY699_14490 [Deltaproteobacteria bacterium]|nr:hypothetical protein [Deltaproteobacteria bacterium]
MRALRWFGSFLFVFGAIMLVLVYVQYQDISTGAPMESLVRKITSIQIQLEDLHRSVGSAITVRQHSSTARERLQRLYEIEALP